MYHVDTVAVIVGSGVTSSQAQDAAHNLNTSTATGVLQLAPRLA